MIVITGGLGFIGSTLYDKFVENKMTDLIIIDTEKNVELDVGKYVQYKSTFSELNKHNADIDVIYHFGAITDTTCVDVGGLRDKNLEYSQALWYWCTRNSVPLIYASSASIYGDGRYGFKDDEKTLENSKPLNLYAKSKSDFDKWVLKEEGKPFNWLGLRIFNAYGHKEGQKGRMASMVYQLINQVLNTGKVELFKSNDTKYGDGAQKRDFICVDEIVDFCFAQHSKYKTELGRAELRNGIYNIGTGEPTSFNEIVGIIGKILETDIKIKYIDTPDKISKAYQNYTCSTTNILTYKINKKNLEQNIKNVIMRIIFDREKQDLKLRLNITNDENS